MMNFFNSIYYKTLVALYRLNDNGNGRSKSIVVNAIYEGLLVGKEGLDKAKLEMSLETATEDWLDYWGNLFGVPRWYDEGDDFYRKRIIDEVITPKNTIEGIQKGASRYINLVNKEDLLPESIRVFEPWTQLLKLDERGVLDGFGRLMSHDYWNYSIIDVTLPESNYLTKDLINYLNRIKAAGVKLVFSVSPRFKIITDKDRAERNTHVYNKIHGIYCIQVSEIDPTIFSTAPMGSLDKIKDSIENTVLDGPGILEGKQKIYWPGIELTRSYQATGPIRNYFGGILSLEDYKRYLQKEEVSIGEAIELDQEVKTSTREKEAALSMRLKAIEIKRERIDENGR